MTGRSRPQHPPGTLAIRARRIIIAGLLTGLLLGYVGPISSYLTQRAELRQESARLATLEQSRDDLKRRIAALETTSVLEARARATGLVRPGERAFIVRGTLDSDPPPPAPSDDGGLLGWISLPF